ncbi:type VI secretion system membrane subunit TssM [Leptothrix ochracea]|uniref:type VI secretion system membrane subunit TssM n=1 Tax=Leptothrix ochracea TaxID=735331 RepID=UPI0034E2C3CF
MNKLFALIVLLLLALLIWFGGPLLGLGNAHPLDAESHRWISIGVLTVLTLGWLAWGAWRARRKNKAVVDQLLAPPPQAVATPAGQTESADMQAVRQRFESALVALRKARFTAENQPSTRSGWWSNLAARFGGRYLYELPWYLIIGAPGSGKTTALCNAGLKFPLAELNRTSGEGVAPVPGIGGTRHCDWWFTDQAVLIDTAGRFTTQDSDRDNDRATWGGFLALLKKSRPRQPVNGVLVTVSVSDLLTRSASERAQHAATVRQRIQELHEQLGIRFPIYLLVTKTDLLAGFMDYFSTLDSAQRAEPWGLTLDLDATQHTDISGFAPQFDALVQRLDAGLIERVQAERDVTRRTRIYGFPAQLVGLREPLHAFIDAVFSPSSLEAHPLLRGVYLISGTQEGTPIDRLLGSVARQFRLERAILPPQQASGRSYFLNRLLLEVVFAESALGGINLRWEKRRRQLTLAAYAALALGSVGFASLFVLSFVHNRSYVTAVEQQTQQQQERLRKESATMTTADVWVWLPLLESTRRVAALSEDSAATQGTLGWGLFQGDKLDAAARLAYERMLVDGLLPRLAERIEAQLRESGDDARQYEALKTYLILHDGEHFEAEALQATFERDLTPEQRTPLNSHLAALLALRPVLRSPKDEALISRARAELAVVSLPQRVYNHLRRQGLGSEIADVSILSSVGGAAGSMGGAASLIFARASGAPLTQGVPGIYTFEGYHLGFQRQVSRSAKVLAAEQAWVLGLNPATTGSITETALNEAVRRLYLQDYASTWEAFMADIRLQPITSVQQAIEMTRLLSAPDSPMLPLLKTIARHTTLSAPLEKGLLQKAESRAKDMLAQVAPSADVSQLEKQLVDDRFTALRQYITAPEGGKAPIEGTMTLISEVHVLLNAVDTAIKSRMPIPPSEVPNKLKAEASRLPLPMRGMVENISNSSAKAAMLGVRQTLSQEVKANLGEFCQQALSGRYPFDRRSSRDVTPADFATLFAPGGKFDRFTQERLLPYVDTSARPWRFLDRDNASLGSDAGTLAQFQRAAAIRDAFFQSGGNMPTLRVELKPIDMDSSINQWVIDIDGQVLRYSHGPQIPTQVQWPGPRGTNQIRVQVSPAGASGEGQLIEGPWALLRLFDGRRLEPGRAPERFRVVFEFDGRKATFEVTASSVRNPFMLRELSEFSCPNSL